MAAPDVLIHTSETVQSLFTNITAAFESTNATTSTSILSTTLRYLSRTDRFLFSYLPHLVFRVTGLNILYHNAVELLGLENVALNFNWFPNIDVFGIFDDTPAGANAGAGAARGAGRPGGGWHSSLHSAYHASSHKSYWGMVHYLTSRWAFLCLVMAVLISRIKVICATRHRINFNWQKRFALRFIPLVLLVSQTVSLSRGIRCQSSVEFGKYRHGDADLYSVLDWSTEGGWMHELTNAMLFWEDEEKSCRAVGMSGGWVVDEGGSGKEVWKRAERGSFSLLWPTFLNFGLSHVVENLACCLQQMPIMGEVGVSVFEHSLAFAEAETMVAHTLGRGASKVEKENEEKVDESKGTEEGKEGDLAAEELDGNYTVINIPASGAILAITDAVSALTSPHAFDRINVPIEVLLVALISCFNHISSHIINILGRGRQLRLINTGFWALCYIGSFIYGFFSPSDIIRTDTAMPQPMTGLLHFPTVAIVGFLPHILVLIGVVICGFIYVLALLLTAISLGSNSNIRYPTTLKERFAVAHDNLQVTTHFKSANIRWHEDFYTALLRLGFAVLTVASEAVFLNEGRRVEMKQFTWLEEERLDELDAIDGGQRDSTAGRFQIVEEYGIPRSPASELNDEWQSGYAIEKKLQDTNDKALQTKGQFVYPNPRNDGIGALQRTTRFYLLMIFLRGIFFTIGGWTAYGFGVLLDCIGITTRPHWLKGLIGASLKKMQQDRKRLDNADNNDNGNTSGGEKDDNFSQFRQSERARNLARMSLDIDVEAEMRRKIEKDGGQVSDEAAETTMYDWWKGGGWFGTRDESGEYVPSSRADESEYDTTSIYSLSTTADSQDQDQDQTWESEPEGTRTPTRTNRQTWSFEGLRQRPRSRSSTPVDTQLLDDSTLARLLDPQDKESREEARILSSHLATVSGVMTRSRYREQQNQNQRRVLLSARTIGSRATGKALSGDEEAQALEQLLRDRRAQKARLNASRQSDTNAPASMGTNSTTGSAGNTASTKPAENDEDANLGKVASPPCVVCQTEARTIIAWPCRCLTVCEDCRVNLAMNNFGNCVTCRRSVGGFVRLYVP